jgi:hypothetical protein
MAFKKTNEGALTFGKMTVLLTLTRMTLNETKQNDIKLNYTHCDDILKVLFEYLLVYRYSDLTSLLNGE